MAVKRYDYIGQGDCEMAEFENGPYVQYTDYAALEEECAQLREKIGRLTSDPIEPIEGGPT